MSIPQKLLEKYILDSHKSGLFSAEELWELTELSICCEQYYTVYDNKELKLYIFCDDKLVSCIKCNTIISPKTNKDGKNCIYHYFYVTEEFKNSFLYDYLVYYGAISGNICYVHRAVYVLYKKVSILGV